MTTRTNNADAVGRSRLAREIKARLHAAAALSLYLDYDGTLSPIRRSPAAAVLPRTAATLLRDLVRQPAVSVAIVTGRSLSDIRRRVRGSGIALITNHGFQIVDSGGAEWTHPAAVKTTARLRITCTALAEVVAATPGALLENKGLTATVHFRNVLPRKARELRSAVRHILRSDATRFRIVTGKKVIEIRPPVAWGKGHAVVRLLDRTGRKRRALPIYIGDDTTDEDAFLALRSRGITVRVGHSRKTAARFTVRSPAEVRMILRLILEVWKARRTARP